MSDKQCLWTYDEQYDKWDTACGEFFCCLVGNPQNNGMKFCPYCGKELTTQPQPQRRKAERSGLDGCTKINEKRFYRF